MRIAFAVAMIVCATPAFAQNTKSIPDDFISKMSKDLAALHADPPPAEANAGSGQAGSFVSVPEKVAVDKDNTTLWASEPIGPSTTTMHAPRGTEAPVKNAVQGWYQVELNNNSWWVQTSDVAPTGPVRRIYTAGTTAAADPTWLGQQIEKLMKSASAFRDSYKDNPYVVVHGFSINVGVPPSVNVDFEFK